VVGASSLHVRQRELLVLLLLSSVGVATVHTPWLNTCTAASSAAYEERLPDTTTSKFISLTGIRVKSDCNSSNIRVTASKSSQETGRHPQRLLVNPGSVIF
jgi:hypothetical protein